MGILFLCGALLLCLSFDSIRFFVAGEVMAWEGWGCLRDVARMVRMERKSFQISVFRPS